MTLFRKCAHRPSVGVTRPALLNYREDCLTVPYAAGARKSRAPEGKPAQYGDERVPNVYALGLTRALLELMAFPRPLIHCFALPAHSAAFFLESHLKKLTGLIFQMTRLGSKIDETRS
jgi:hypothetical protein